MALSVIQTSFAAGELAPNFYARVDIEKYKVGASLLRNFIVDYRGGASTRWGTQWCGRAKVTGVLTARVIDFIINTTTAYVIELGNYYARFYYNAAQVVEAPKSVVGFTQASPGVVTIYAHGFNNGDEIIITGLGGMTILNNKNYIVENVTTNTFSLTDLDGNQINTGPPVPPYTGGGQATRVFTLTTPWAAADLALVKYSQSASSMTLTHPNYPPYDIVQVTASSFTCTPTLVGPQVQGPATIATSAINNANTATTYAYQITAVSVDGKEESVPGPISVVNCEVLGASDNDMVKIQWNATVCSHYNIYKSGPGRSGTSGPATPINTILGYIGQSLSTTFIDNNIAPDFTKTAPTFQDPFSPGQIQQVIVSSSPASYSGLYTVPLIFTGDGSGAAGYGVIDPNTHTVVSVVLTLPGKNYTHCTVTDAVGSTSYTVTLGQESGTYPFCVGYFQQRRVFGGTTNAPESFVASQPGKYNNFDTTIFGLASDAITASIASRQVNFIVSLTAMSTGLIIFTTGGAFLVSGGGLGTAITPETIVALPQASSGANNLPPLVVYNNLLYCQARGFVLRDMAFNYYTQSYIGTDRSILSSHLFLGYTPLEWCWAEEPNRFVNIVRSDGQLLMFTYVLEQEVFAWTHADTQGTFQSICAIPEGNATSVYTIVQRVINGVTRAYVERFAYNVFNTIQTAWCVDCGVMYSGAPSLTFTGLDYLDGLTVVGLADGSPFTTVVNTGSITLPSGVAASTVIVGLSYTCQLQTLRLDLGEPTVQGKRKSVPAVTLIVNNAIGLQVGHDFNTLETVVETQIPYTPPFLAFSGETRTVIGSSWDTDGYICVQQSNPLPATILGIVPEVVVGDTSK